MDINYTPEDAGAIFQKATDLVNLEDTYTVKFDTSGKDKVIHYIELNDARRHDRSIGDGLKKETGGTATPITIEVDTYYEMLYFDDKHDFSSLEQEVFNKLPSFIAKAALQLPAGYLFNQDGTTKVAPVITDTAEIDGTLASFVGALEGVEANGYDVSRFNLDKRAKTLVRTANTNSLSTLNNIGTTGNILETPAQFLRKFAPVGEFGWAGDRDANILVIQPQITAEVHLPENDWFLRQRNEIGVYVGVRMGVASLPGSAVRLVANAGS